MKLSEAIEAFVTATLAAGRSVRTTNDYRQKLGELQHFLEDCSIEAITTDDLRRFIVHLRNRQTRFEHHPYRREMPGGLVPASIAGYVRVIRRFCRFLQDEGHISSNPSERLSVPKVPRHEPKACSLEDFEKLLAATDGDSVINRRDRAILLFLADTGCRVGGLCRLRLSDLDLERSRARLLEKGNKARWTPFLEPTRKALIAWLEVRPDVGTDRVFVNLGTKRKNPYLTEDAVGEVLRRLKGRCGVKGPVNPHSFRHAFAREYLQNGGDLATLADLLGHSSTDVTWRYYAIFTGEELAVKHARHSPIAKLQREGKL